MDNERREEKSEGSRESSVKPSPHIFFLNNEPVKLIHSNRANNICYVHNYIHNKEQTMLLSDFKKHRKRAYTVANTLRIFKRSRAHLERLIKDGVIPKPIGAIEGGVRTFTIKSYYSEDHLFIIRDAMANIHMGRPRRDGKITTRKDVISEKDLRSLIGSDIMLYTKTEDGRFIPVWQEETW